VWLLNGFSRPLFTNRLLFILFLSIIPQHRFLHDPLMPLLCTCKLHLPLVLEFRHHKDDFHPIFYPFTALFQTPQLQYSLMFVLECSGVGCLSKFGSGCSWYKRILLPPTLHLNATGTPMDCFRCSCMS